MLRYTERPEFTISFEQSIEQDFFIRRVGFQNFTYIKPIKYFRTQKFYTLHIVLEGSGIVKVADREYKAVKGDMFFIPPLVNLCYFPDEENPWNYIWFELVGDNAALYGEKMGFAKDAALKKCKGFDNILFLLDRIFTDRMNGCSIGYYDILSVFYRILDRNIRKTDGENMTDAVMNYIDCHYACKNLNISDICSHFHISRSYLCKLFKETRNDSMKKYMIKVRMNEAGRLLETTDMCIKEIAYAVGFSDSVHFMKQFKKYMGRTPTEYRKFTMVSEEKNRE